ncbi:MAG: hypothetical protein M3275_09695 [Thermoproteota archaeon]|nr:hypothetical protein [Thermoproteota archaeon]
MSKNPNDEQLAQALDMILSDEPEKKEARLNLRREFLKTYTFMATTTPRSGAVMLDRIKLPIASSGR